MSKHRLHEDDETTLLPRVAADPAALDPAPRPGEGQAQVEDPALRPAEGQAQVEDPALRPAEGQAQVEDPALRPAEGQAQVEDPALRPAEGQPELGPAERRAQLEEPAPRRLARQPLVIGVATMCLLVSGAAAWALAKPTPQPSVSLPTGGPSTTAAGFTDGFGVMTPSAAAPSEVAPARPSASPTAPASSPRVSPAPASSGPRPSNQPAAAPGAASATYDVNAWGNGYVISVRVRNTGATPLAWTVRIRLPKDSTVDGDWEADRSGQDGVWVFTPERGSLSPGATVTFGFIGRRGPGDFQVTCTVNDIACQAD